MLQELEVALQEKLSLIKEAKLIAVADFLQGLVVHWHLIEGWRQNMNLTTIKERKAAAYLHYLDSLEGLPFIYEGPILDIGSGAGFPGIPLALARPDCEFTLLEAKRKKVSFLQTVVSTLGLKNVQVVHGRLEHFSGREYAHALTRAVFSDIEGLAQGLEYLKESGTLLSYRAERSAIAPDKVVHWHDYRLQQVKRVIEIWRRS